MMSMLDRMMDAFDEGAMWGRNAYERAGRSKIRQITRLAKATSRLLTMSVHYVRENDIENRPLCGCTNCHFVAALREFASALGKPSPVDLHDEVRRIFAPKMYQ